MAATTRKMSIKNGSPNGSHFICGIDGLKINVNLNELIEKIYIHPKSENWYKKLVIELVSKLDFKIEIEKSDLESDILI